VARSAGVELHACTGGGVGGAGGCGGLGWGGGGRNALDINARHLPTAPENSNAEQLIAVLVGQIDI